MLFILYSKDLSALEYPRYIWLIILKNEPHSAQEFSGHMYNGDGLRHSSTVIHKSLLQNGVFVLCFPSTLDQHVTKG